MTSIGGYAIGDFRLLIRDHYNSFLLHGYSGLGYLRRELEIFIIHFHHLRKDSFYY
jgi:hypothetical protein